MASTLRDFRGPEQELMADPALVLSEWEGGV